MTAGLQSDGLIILDTSITKPEVVLQNNGNKVLPELEEETLEVGNVTLEPANPGVNPGVPPESMECEI